MRIGILYSGGKDSNFAAYYYSEQGWDIVCLISLISKRSDSWMFHTPNINLVSLQAEAMEIPIIQHVTSGEKEEELKDLENALSQAKKLYKIEGVAVGAIASDYQYERVNRICHKLNLKCYAPLWHKSQELLLSEMIDLGFDIRISSVSAEGLTKKWLGRKIDKTALEELKNLNKKYELHIAGEGGEYETFVADCPLFKKRISIMDAEPLMEKNSGVYVIKKAILLSK